MFLKVVPPLHASAAFPFLMSAFLTDTFMLPFTPPMFDIDGRARRDGGGPLFGGSEASITSRAETLIRMELPMRSLRRWNQAGRGQHFPSRTMRRKEKILSPFFPPF